MNKFRSKYDYNQYLFKYWQIASDQYYPQRWNFGYYYEIQNNNGILKNVFNNKKIKLVCLNDANEKVRFDEAKEEIKSIFEQKFPHKSSFEI